MIAVRYYRRQLLRCPALVDSRIQIFLPKYWLSLAKAALRRPGPLPLSPSRATAATAAAGEMSGEDAAMLAHMASVGDGGSIPATAAYPDMSDAAAG